MQPFSDIAFTPAVKAIQTERGSREMYARQEARGGFRVELTDDLDRFLEQVDTAYFATANADGQPYAQHRGGPKGFIRRIGPSRLGFADFAGNRQYITTGNLGENSKAFLFLMDYANRRRIKLWGAAQVITDDPALVERLMPKGYAAKAEQAIVFDVAAWDVNCPQHIPRKIALADAQDALESYASRVAALETENAALRAQLEEANR